MSTTAKGFWLLVLAQAGFLLAWAGYHEWVRQNAPVILLKCRPVDPQDLLRGDYMTLDYDISHPATIGGKADVPHRGRGAGVQRCVGTIPPAAGRGRE